MLNVHPFTLEHQGGQSVPRSHQFKAPEVIEAMTKFARSHGVKILTGVSANRLYWDEKGKRICGVKAVNAKKEILSFMPNEALLSLQADLQEIRRSFSVLLRILKMSRYFQAQVL